jgi:SAM-dependent methyltransferase
MPARFRPSASGWQRMIDHALFPLNMWLSEERSEALGLTPIDHERIRAALPYVHGRLLDIACGNNLLVRAHNAGVGVDVHPYPEADVLCFSDRLPFRDESFDSVAMLACLNHIVRRRETLGECHRVLTDGGMLVITMIPKWVGVLSHPIRRRHDPDQLERGIAQEESLGLSTSYVRSILAEGRFKVTVHKSFMWGLNHVFVATKS